MIQDALFFGRSKASALTIPWCTFTDPEIAHVGLYEQQAWDKGIAVETFTVEMADVDRAMLHGDALLTGKIGGSKLAQIGPTVTVPYVVSTLSSVGATLARRQKKDESR